MLKIAFDYSVAIIGLVVLSPVMLIIACLIKLESRGPVFYRQERMGKNRKPFQIHKFRSMYVGSDAVGLLTAGSEDKRITKTGHIIRKLHLDEVVQLIDVLQGNMSIVGPRPEVPLYTQVYTEIWDEILTVKPGITGPSVIELSRWEYEILGKGASDVMYRNVILPKKLELDLEYVRTHSIVKDFGILFRTFELIFLRLLKDNW